MKLYIIMKYSRRKLLYHLFARRLKAVYLLLLFLCLLLLLRWRTKTLPPLETSLEHFERTRDLRHYFQQVELLIEPSSGPCTNSDQVPLIAVVGSRPTHVRLRDAVRHTWGRKQPTLFFLGLDPYTPDGQLIDSYMEAKKYDDLVVYDFPDHLQNDTIKTALMMKWTLFRCPQAEFLMKNTDQVVVNPWMMTEVLKDHEDFKLLGQIHRQVSMERQKDAARYIPQWMMSQEVIPQHLSGHTYLISGEYLRQIVNAARDIPLVNLEDVYFTHLVASHLGYKLTNDDRLALTRPYPHWACAYWSQAVISVNNEQEAEYVWAKINQIGAEYEKNGVVCDGLFVKILMKLVYWF